MISIHAPTMESDHLFYIAIFNDMYFNPRSHYGERLTSPKNLLARAEFQSTLPLWRATVTNDRLFFKLYISIHAPTMESDVVD